MGPRPKHDRTAADPKFVLLDIAGLIFFLAAIVAALTTSFDRFHW
jgi:hypothetical protein